MPKIEVFGLEASPSTRAAVRFFRERRIVVRFIDLSKKPIEPSELRAFRERLGASHAWKASVSTRARPNRLTPSGADSPRDPSTAAHTE
jgi:arsenate reductase-like glutaredoxin family protein